MSKETAWMIVQTVEGDEYVDYTRLEGVAEQMMGRDDTEVLAIGYDDVRSEWEKIMSLAEFGDGIDTDVDHEKTVDSINFEIVAKHFDEETAEELERVGRNWSGVSDDEQMAFVLMVDKLYRMSTKAKRMLESKAWSTSLGE
jgi:hypothetical protein